MTTDQTALNTPEPMDWTNYHIGGKFRRPPNPFGPDGKYLTYYATVPQDIKVEVTKAGDRCYLFDPLALVRSGPEADGYQLRFSRASVKKFVNRRTREPMEASMVGNYLRAAGVKLKPQTIPEYDAAVNATRGHIIPLNIDWVGKDKETGIRVRGYKNFPDDPERPGQKKAILSKGDAFIDEDGAAQTFTGEVLFANAELKYFVDPTRGKR